MHKIKMMAIVGVAVIFIAGVAFAQPEETRGGPQQKNFKEIMQKKLGITEEQHQKLEANRKSQEEVMKSLRAAMQEQRSKLQEALKDPEATRSIVEPIVTEMKSLQAQLIDQRINGIFIAKSILTPEQFAKFNEIAGKHFQGKKGGLREKMKERKEKRPMEEDEELFDEPPPPAEMMDGMTD